MDPRCPGLNHQLSPRRRFTGDDACQLWWQITGYRIWLMHQPEPDALELLACEGLLNVIRSEGEVTPTGRLLELVEAVRAA